MQMQLLLKLCSWNSPLAKFLKCKKRALICWKKLFSILRSHSKLLKTTFLRSLCNISSHIMYEFLFPSMDFQSHTSLTDSSGYISLNDYQLSRTPQMRVTVQTLMHLPLLVLLYWQGNWALFNRSHISIKVFRKSDHILFLLFSSYASAKRSSIWWQSITTSAGRILMDLRGVFNNLSMIIESNQQSVQTLLRLAIFTFLIFQLVLLTSVGLWFLKVQCHLFFFPVLFSNN